MKLYVILSIVIVCIISQFWTAEAGIIRRSRRIHRFHEAPNYYEGRLARAASRYWRERMAERRRERLPHFLAPPRRRNIWSRSSRRYRFSPASEREDRFGHSRPRLPLMMRPHTRERDPLMASGSNPVSQSWRPLDYGNPIDRDPLFDYAPPSVERVRFGDNRRHKNGGKPPRGMNKKIPGGNRRPPLFDKPRRPPTGPALWKLLAAKQSRPRPYQQRPRRPPFMRFPESKFKDEAEIAPQLNGLVYFKPQDVINANGQFVKPTIPPGYKPGVIQDAPLYSGEVQSTSQFNPVTSTTPRQPPSPIDILYTPHKFINQMSQSPSVLQPVRPQPVYTQEEPVAVETQDGNGNDETVIAIVQEPSNSNGLNSFTLYNQLSSNDASEHDEGEASNLSENVIPAEKPRPVFQETFPAFRPSPLITTTTTTTEQPEEDLEEEQATAVSVSTSVSSSVSMEVNTPERVKTPVSPVFTTTAEPEEPAYVEEITTKATTTTARPRGNSFLKLPEMPTYKKRQPIYPKRPSPTTKSPANVNASPSSKEASSGEQGLVITMARSKVKEYKPQFLANHKQFLTFDKVAEVETVKEAKDAQGEGDTTPSLTVITSTPVSTRNGTDSESPLQEFDPMQLVHNWFQNS